MRDVGPHKPCELEVDPGGGGPGEGEDLRMEVEGEDHAERWARILEDPGRPAPGKVERHLVPHLPFRSWRPARAARNARDRMHRRTAEEETKRAPERAFDHNVLGLRRRRCHHSRVGRGGPPHADDLRTCYAPEASRHPVATMSCSSATASPR